MENPFALGRSACLETESSRRAKLVQMLNFHHLREMQVCSKSLPKLPTRQLEVKNAASPVQILLVLEGLCGPANPALDRERSIGDYDASDCTSRFPGP
jgi:hypothetical protein